MIQYVVYTNDSKIILDGVIFILILTMKSVTENSGPNIFACMACRKITFGLVVTIMGSLVC